MTDLIPWLLFGIATLSMTTLIGILLWYTGLTEANRYESSCDCGEHDL